MRSKGRRGRRVKRRKRWLLASPAEREPEGCPIQQDGVRRNWRWVRGLGSPADADSTTGDQAGRFWRPGDPEYCRAIRGQQTPQDNGYAAKLAMARIFSIRVTDGHHGPLEEGWHVQGG